MRPLLALLLVSLLAGCTVYGDVVTDAEIREKGQWTAADTRARKMLQGDRSYMQYERVKGRVRPIRLVPKIRRQFDIAKVGTVEIPIPRITSSGGIDLGGPFYETRSYAIPSKNALIILHRDRPPTIVPLDPNEPVAPLGEEELEDAYDMLRDQIEADLRDVPKPPGTSAP